jgi:hypothetical protein
MLGMDRAELGLPAIARKRRAKRPAAEGGQSGTAAAPLRKRQRRGGEERDPPWAVIQREINTRRWPSIEMQARPNRYKWTPQDTGGTRDTDKSSG